MSPPSSPSLAAQHVGRGTVGPADGRRRRFLSLDIAIPLAVFMVLSAVSAVLLAVGASRQLELPQSTPGYTVRFPTEASPGFWGVMSNWDGQWYRSIAERGYPVPLPMGGGHVARNEWAFYPLYPLLVRGVMTLTGLGFGPSAWLVSISCGAVAAVLLFRFLRPRMGQFGAAAQLTCVLAYAAAPALQVGYTESLALLLIVAALTVLRSRRYGLVVIVALLLSLARPVVLPLAGVVVIHGLVRWRAARKGGDSFPPRERWKVAGAVVVTAAAMGLWPLVVGVTTGRRNAFIETQEAWPVNQDAAGLLGGWTAEVLRLTPLGLAGLLCGLLVVVLVSRRPAAVWGSDLRVWALVYPLYLLLGSRPSPSMLRYFMLTVALLWPLPDLVSAKEDGGAGLRIARWALLVVPVLAGLVGQYFWVTRYFIITVSPDHQPFP